MKIVVDTNIVFSGLLSPRGTISDLLLNSASTFDFYAPYYLLDELSNHRNKLLKLSGYSESEIDFLMRCLFKKIDFIELETISSYTWEKAMNLVNDVDEFDAPFIALALEMNAPLWTGDKKLFKGLYAKGVDWVLSTEYLIRERN